MKRFGLLVVALFLVVLDPTSSSSVVELTDDDFKSRIGEIEWSLVMFYAPWCGHCKKLKPEFDLASGILLDNDPPVRLVKVDCSGEGKETCTLYGVTGYPTLKIFKNGKNSKDYNGPREAQGIAKYMASQVGPSSKELTDTTSFDKFLSSSDNGVVGFFKDKTKLKETFLEVADELREKFRFGSTSVDELLVKNDIDDGIVLFRPKHLQNIFEPSQLKYEGKPTKVDLQKWLKDNIHGLVDHRTRDNSAEFKNPLVVAYYNVDYDKNVKGTNYWRNRILKVAQNYVDDFQFAVSSKDDFQHELNEYGHDYVPTQKPLVFARSKDNKKFAMTDEFTVENFESFLSKLKNDELEPYVKSEPIPDSNDKPVKVAVGKNFDDVVTNNGKDTLIEFYAPWCGHCKKLTPIWDELGEKLVDEEVAIVKMDATANDVPSTFEVRGFPTIYWAAKGKKDSPVAYNGGREIGDFIKFIAKEATNELKSYDRKGELKSKDEL